MQPAPGGGVDDAANQRKRTRSASPSIQVPHSAGASSSINGSGSESLPVDGTQSDAEGPVPQSSHHVQSHGSSTQRLHRAALCGLLWHPECQALSQSANPITRLPTCFSSPQHYVDMFEPLLHEEARGGLANSWEEIQGGSEGLKGWHVRVSNPVQESGGWFRATLDAMPGGRGGGRFQPYANGVRSGNVIVLNKVVTQGGVGTAGQAGGSGGRGRGGRGGGQPYQHHATLTVAGIVKQGSQTASEPIIVSFHPCCPYHDPQDWSAPCNQAMRELLDHNTGWHLQPLGPLVTFERECETLSRVAQGDRGPMSSLLPMLLDPAQAARSCRGHLAQVWPEDFTCPELMTRFGSWLAESYDLPQREAIQMSTSHLALEHQLASSPIPVLPFTLIQGPPGTGKTHTVKGILNMWHVIKYRRYHDSWRVQAAKELEYLQATCTSWDRCARAQDLLSDLHTRLPKGASRPRVLVCAPSNAATDELCERILKEGFRDLSLGVTFPDLARVGSEDSAMSDVVKDVWIEARVRWHMSMDRGTFALEFKKAEARQAQAAAAITALLNRLDHYAMRGEEGMMELAGLLVDLQAQRTRAELDLSRLGIVAPLHVPGRRVHAKALREELELSCMEAAELVFTTLSSTGRHVFSRFKKPFDAVLIDEACQAAEVAALQPLVHGTSKVVLVGDPKQLPATLFSRAAKETAMERSLFERLSQAGVPVKLLAVQYRMHPEIRTFPSAFFYDNQLEDAPQVINMEPAPFYHSDLLKPYVVFDVQHGKEDAGRGGRSKCNAAEAKLAAGLFWELRCEMMAAFDAAKADPSLPMPGRIDVGVVTPYRSQRDLLRTTFAELLGPEVLSEVRIETVDSFQGKQLDVIILSCVRAFAPSASGAGGASGSIGFLADTRRLNVAITRAKQALWVVGQAASLAQNQVWKALLDDAAARGCMVMDANADDPLLLPHFTEHLARRRDGAAKRPRFTHTPEPGPSVQRGQAAGSSAAPLPAAAAQGSRPANPNDPRLAILKPGAFTASPSASPAPAAGSAPRPTVGTAPSSAAAAVPPSAGLPGSSGRGGGGPSVGPPGGRGRGSVRTSALVGFGSFQRAKAPGAPQPSAASRPAAGRGAPAPSRADAHVAGDSAGGAASSNNAQSVYADDWLADAPAAAGKVAQFPVYALGPGRQHSPATAGVPLPPGLTNPSNSTRGTTPPAGQTPPK